MFDWLARWLRRTPSGVGEGALVNHAASVEARPHSTSAPNRLGRRQAALSDTAWAPTVQMDDAQDTLLEEWPEGARDESERRSLALLQARGLSALQYVAETAARICETPMAAVSLMDGESVWFQAVVGADLQRLPRNQTFCAHAVGRMPELLEVPDALDDPRFQQLALVTRAPHIRFYAGAPFVTAGNLAMGAVSVADTVPRELTPVQRRTLELLARQTVMLLDARARKDDALTE